jgi:hypothetical protein
MNILIFFIDADCSIYPVNMLEKVFVDQNNVEYGFPPEGGVMEVVTFIMYTRSQYI